MASGLKDSDADEFLPDQQDEEADADAKPEDDAESDNNGPPGSSGEAGGTNEGEGEHDNDVTQSVRLQIEQLLAAGDFAAILKFGKAVPHDLREIATTGLAQQLNIENVAAAPAQGQSAAPTSKAKYSEAELTSPDKDGPQLSSGSIAPVMQDDIPLPSTFELRERAANEAVKDVINPFKAQAIKNRIMDESTGVVVDRSGGFERAAMAVERAAERLGEDAKIQALAMQGGIPTLAGVTGMVDYGTGNFSAVGGSMQAQQAGTGEKNYDPTVTRRPGES